jgi:hypothetical protein
MATAALIATQLTDRSSRAWTLQVGMQPDILGGTSAAAYRVPIETIRVNEQESGGVSSMSFDIVDPTLAYTPTEMDFVQLWDVTNARPQFAGYLQGWTVKPEGPNGRRWMCRCVGVEAVLDWMVTRANSYASGSNVREAVQSIIGSAYGVGVALDFTSDDGNGGYAGTQSQPVASFTAIGSACLLTETVAIEEGETVREALRKVLDVSVIDNHFYSTIDAARGVATVDFYLGARVRIADAFPVDYADLTIAESGTTAMVLEHETDALGAVRQVFVSGGNAAGSGVVSAGTGVPGPIAGVSNADSLTASAKEITGTAYLSRQASATRGRLAVSTLGIPSTNVRAGGEVVLTSTPLALTAQRFVISAISKTFLPGGRQTWDVDYGGLPPSAIRVIRRLTRTVRS